MICAKTSAGDKFLLLPPPEATPFFIWAFHGVFVAFGFAVDAKERDWIEIPTAFSRLVSSCSQSVLLHTGNPKEMQALKAALTAFSLTVHHVNIDKRK